MFPSVLYKTGAKNLQMMKKLALALLQLVKESYKKSMKLIRYELSLDYENGIEKTISTSIFIVNIFLPPHHLKHL